MTSLPGQPLTDVHRAALEKLGITADYLDGVPLPPEPDFYPGDEYLPPEPEDFYPGDSVPPGDAPGDEPPDNVRRTPKRPAVPGLALTDTDPNDLYVHGDDPEREREPSLADLLAEPLRMAPATVQADHKLVGGAVAAALDGRLRKDPHGVWWAWSGHDWTELDRDQVDSVIKGMIGREDAESRARRCIVPYQSRKLTRELVAQLDAAGAGHFDDTAQQFRRTDGELVTSWPFPADEWAGNSDTAARIRRDIGGRETVAMAEDFDTEPDMINAKGMVISLHADDLPPVRGNIHPVAAAPLNRRVLISRSLGTHFEPTADCPKWQQFVIDVTSYRTPGTSEIVYQYELATFLQVLTGLTLLGRMQEQILVILHGTTGSNGKSVFAHTLTKLFGDYAATLPKAVLMEQRGERHTTDLTMLKGARMGYIKETQRARWDVEMAKDLASNEDLTARKMRQDNTSWRPTHTLWTTTNNAPLVPAGEQAFWRRVIMVPFKQRWSAENDSPAMKKASIGPINPYLADELEEELPGILNWAIDGLRLYYEAGKLVVPQVVRDANEAARLGGSLWAEFIATNVECTEDERDVTERRDLWKMWEEFRVRNSAHTSLAPTSQRAMEEMVQGEYPTLQVRGRSGGHANLAFVGLRLTDAGRQLANKSVCGGARWGTP